MDSDVYKVLESAAWELQHRGDPGLTDFVDRTAGLLEHAQQEDGYLNSHYQVASPGARYTKLVDSHELYCAGHLFQAAVAAHLSTSDTRLLTVARRLADHLAAVFLDSAGPGLDGHPEVETALVELYRVTGDERHLALASALVERPRPRPGRPAQARCPAPPGPSAGTRGARAHRPRRTRALPRGGHRRRRRGDG